MLFILVPLKDRLGNYAGVAGGEIDPTSPLLSRTLRLSDPGRNIFMDVMDSNGIVIASSDDTRTLKNCNRENFFGNVIRGKKVRIEKCHSCHVSENSMEKQTNILAFVPLEMAPWGVSIVQLEKDVYAPVRRLKVIFIFFSTGSVIIAMLMAFGMSRSIVKPVHELIDATRKIASGDMTKSIEFGGIDEIGMLGSSFEVMRLRLADSMETLQSCNLKLEERVASRTKEIRQSRERAEMLLKKAISAQEDERKRISRELHDDTLQDLSALLMRIDMCMLYPENVTYEKIEEIRTIVLKSHDDVLSIVKNLRPSLLDDLGLEAAIKWLLDTHFGRTPVKFFFRTSGFEDIKLKPEVEITVFRIIQEAISNIAKYAGAENVFLIMKADSRKIIVDIEDDGKGFDVHFYCRHEALMSNDGTGLGLLGMRERAALINGKVRVFSSPGHGTRISLIIPFRSGGQKIA